MMHPRLAEWPSMPRTASRVLPQELQELRANVLRAIQPIVPAGDSTEADPKFLFNAQRTAAGRELPPYFLVYFLFVDFLNFRHLGQFEKVAWSVPIDFEGQAFLIEHRKMGLGVFARDAKAEEAQARRIVTLVKKGVEVAAPFFRWLAEDAVRASEINVVNNTSWLFDRYEYLRDQFRKAAAEARARKDERRITKKKSKHGGTITKFHIPGIELRRKVNWKAIAAMDAFFSWTEHVFIHVAILTGRVTTGSEVAEMIESNWPAKFKRTLDLSDQRTRVLYDRLLNVRRQQRNYFAHGAFGKGGEAFHFHSGAGAVPVMLTDRPERGRFSFFTEVDVEDESAITTIEEFIAHFWSGDREPARIYLQDAELPVILTYSRDGTYAGAMRSVEDMEEFAKHLSRQIDDSANMDW